jgi:transposase-like protein
MEILLTVRWYLQYRLRYRDLVEMMSGRGISISHTPIMEGSEKVHFFKNNKIAEKNEPLESLLRLVSHLGRHH